MSHTPGPWQALPPDKHCTRWIIGQVPPAKNTANFYIAHVYTEAVKYKDVDAEANACLIAAAPDLLAACKSFVQQYDIAFRRQYAPQWEQNALAEIDRAIAKAEPAE
jgi:hypothetical protein